MCNLLTLCPQLSQIKLKDLPAEPSSIKGSLDILTTLLQYKAQLQAVLPSEFTCRVWTELASLDMSVGIDTLCGSERMQLVFEAATEKELYSILQDLKTITVSGQDQYLIYLCIRYHLKINTFFGIRKIFPSTEQFCCL
jgi:hypothetical protein